MTRVAVPIGSVPDAVRDRLESAGAVARAQEPSVLSIATDQRAAKAIARERRKAKHEENLRVLGNHLRARSIVDPVREWKFGQPTVGWAFDLAWPEERVAVEVDGGAFVPGGGRHGRGAGFREDLAKRNAALLMGWRVIHVMPEDVGTSATAELVALAIQAARGTPISSGAYLPGSILAARRKPKRKGRPG